MSCEPGCLTCECLRNAALEIVGQGGMEALSQERLGSMVGMSASEVNEHYRTAADCLYDTYDWVVYDVLRDLQEAFAEGDDWQSGFELSRRRLLEGLSARPAQAWLCFVETTRGDRELRRRREMTRRSIVGFLTREYERRNWDEPLPSIQLEMLIGAGFQLISTAVAEGDVADLVELEAQLEQVQGCFIPSRV